jgi:hypothetical protein
MPTLSTQQDLDSTHVGKRVLLRVVGADTLGTVFLPDGATFTNGDFIHFYVDSLGAGSQIEFGSSGTTPIVSQTRLYRVGQSGTIYFTGSSWQVEVSPTLEAGPPIIKPAPFDVWNTTGNVDFGQAYDHNAYIRSTAASPIVVSVFADSQWTGTAEYWMDGFAPDVGPMPTGGFATFSCHAPAGGITFAPDPGVTINTPSTLTLTKLHGTARLTKVAANEWDLFGDLDPIDPGAAQVGVYNPIFSNVRVLMHGEGTDGTATYTDASNYGHAVDGSTSSTVSVSHLHAYRGTASLHMKAAVNFGIVNQTADEWTTLGSDARPLTFEMALYLDTGATGGVIYGSPSVTGGAFGWLTATLVNLNGPSRSVRFAYNGVQTLVPISSWAFDTFNMIAFAVRGATSHEVGVWVNGIWQGSAVMADTIVTSIGLADRSLNIGRSQGNDQLIGWFDELRITEQLFLPWGANYTINPAAFPDL